MDSSEGAVSDNNKTKRELLKELTALRAEIAAMRNSVSEDDCMPIQAGSQLTEERYRAIVENQVEFVNRYLRGGIMTYVNTALANYVGTRPEDLVGKSFYPFLNEDDCKALIKKLEALSPKQPFVRTENRFLHPDGSIRWHQWIHQAFFDANGQVVEYQAVGGDITALRNAEEAVHQSEKLHRALVETMQEGLAIINSEDVIIYSNDKFNELLGYSRNEIIGHKPWEFLDEENKIILRGELVKRGRGVSSRYEVAITNQGGEKVPTIISATALFDGDGKYNGSFAVFTDISLQKQLEKTLRESDEKLRMHARELEESNNALKVLLKQRENDRKEYEEKILSNLKHLVLPYIEKLKMNKRASEELAFLNIIESNLKEIVSPFSSYFSSEYLCLTPQEMLIADLIKDGKQDKEIAEILNISLDTAKTHRKNIRKKLGLTGKRTNLRAHLLTMAK